MKKRRLNKESIQEMIDNSQIHELEIIWIPRIMERQTNEEVEVHQSINQNKVGLNGGDAPFITSLYESIEDGNHLTEKQASSARKILRKYWRQYLEMRDGN